MLESMARASAPDRRRRLAAVVVTLGVAAGGYAVLAGDGAQAATITSGGWTTNAGASPATVAPGATVSLSVTVTSSTTRRGLVDLEVYRGGTKAFQRFWDDQAFSAGVARTFTASWAVPASEPAGVHAVKVGVFAPGWTSLQHWNDTASSLTVGSSSTTTTARATTTTTVRPTTTVGPTTTVRPTTTTSGAPSARFATLPPRSALPSGATCATQVRPAAEVRPMNAPYDATPGTVANTTYPRVDGHYTGTTDQILQWAACKWGIDEDVVRAQIAVESWWDQRSVGDNGESFGLGQVRTTAHPSAFVDDNAKRSSAYNLDYTYAVFRACYEGELTWLNTVERVGTYAAGDLWGCLGVWFSGRWHTAPAETYIAKVKDYLNQRIWTSQGFLGYQG